MIDPGSVASVILICIKIIYAPVTKLEYAIDLNGVTEVASLLLRSGQKLEENFNTRVWRNRQTRRIWAALLQWNFWRLK